MSSDEHLNILVVENERIVAWELSERLKRMGHKVCGITGKGEEAVKLASEIQPSLVLMDIMLDDEMDGVEAALEIRLNQDTPVIFCSALAKEMQTRARTTNPLAFLEKPLDYVLLGHLLAELTGSPRSDDSC